jgi:hypothetical protein
MVRPSVRCAVISSSDTSTLAINGSVAAAVFIPGMNDRLQVFPEQPAYPIQLPGRKAMVMSQRQRSEPELAGLLVPFDVDMHGLVTVETIEEVGYPFHVP